MKTQLTSFSLLATALLTINFLTGCNKQPPTAPEQPKSAAPVSATPVSAEKTSFQEVTSQLEPGGNVYLYLGTEQWLEGLSAKVGGWRGAIEMLPNVNEDQKQTIGKVFNIVTNLIKNSGLEEVSGFGMSSIAREKGLYHNKMVLHHYPGKGSGLLWSLAGQKAHPLEGLNLLSTNTAIGSFFDLDLALLWSVLRKQVADSGFPQAEAVLNKAPQAFQKGTGLDLEKVLASLGGEFGFVLTLDENKKINVPMPGGNSLEVPEPGLVLVVKVKDDTIFNRADEALKQSPFADQIVRVDKPNLKMRTMPVPLPLPIQLRPTLASSQGYLFLASNDGLIQEMLAIKAGQAPGLKSAPEFQRLAKDTPTQGNQFTFVSKRFSENIMQVQRQAIGGGGNVPPGLKEIFGKFLSAERATFSYTVSANTDQGWVTTSTGNQNPATMLVAAGVIAPVAIVAAVTMPALAKAKSRAQQIACSNNLKQIDLAKRLWATDNNKPDSATPERSDLLSYLNNKFPVCPAGGEYTINSAGEKAECSVPAHKR